MGLKKDDYEPPIKWVVIIVFGNQLVVSINES